MRERVLINTDVRARETVAKRGGLTMYGRLAAFC